MMQSFDVTIVGGGMVGLTLAKCLQKSELSVAVIETRHSPSLSDSPETRVSAINYASKCLLENLGVWPLLVQHRVSGYEAMQVWEKDSFAKIDFDNQAVQQDELGFIIENSNIQQALWQSVQQQENVQLFCPDSIQNLAMGEGEAWITLKSGKQLTSKLVVAADGAHSWVRKQVNIPLTEWDYQHHAIVATVKTELAHEQCARQIFTPQGPLAFLPLYEANLNSIVWSLPPQQAELMMALDDQAFNQALNRAFDNRLGACSVQGQRQKIPLTMRYARDFAQHRVVLIGDAAHTIHPLAGQGVNLGLQDAACLGEQLIELAESGLDVGLYEQLRAFERWRKADALEMITAMQLLKELFAGDNPVKKLLRDSALLVTDKLAPVKKQFVLQAMGLAGKKPELCRPN